MSTPRYRVKEIPPLIIKKKVDPVVGVVDPSLTEDWRVGKKLRGFAR